jgi:hypothetical protein
VSASTQNQAVSALLFLYEVIIERRLAWMHNIVRAQRPARLPVVLSREEVALLLGQLRCFRPPASTWIVRPGNGVGTISTRQSFSER